MNFKTAPFSVDFNRLARSAQNRKLWLQKEIEIQNAWLEAIGPYGAGLLNKFYATGCPEEVNLNSENVASCIVRYRENPSHQFIEYGREALQNRAELFYIRIHEMVHAIQNVTVPVVRAVIEDHRATLFLSPRHYAWMKELEEMNAYAIASYIACLVWDEGLRFTSEFDAATAEMCRNNKPHNVLMVLAAESMISSDSVQMGDVDFNHPNNERSIRIKQWFEEYLINLGARIKINGETSFALVTMEPEDILAIGTTYGFNTFGFDNSSVSDFFSKSLGFSEENNQCLADLNKCFHITNEEQETIIPSFGEILEKDGITRAAFLDQHKPSAYSLC